MIKGHDFAVYRIKKKKEREEILNGLKIYKSILNHTHIRGMQIKAR